MYFERIFSPHIVAVCCPAKMPIIFFVSIFHVSECLLCKWIFRTWRKGKGMWKDKIRILCHHYGLKRVGRKQRTKYKVKLL